MSSPHRLSACRPPAARRGGTFAGTFLCACPAFRFRRSPRVCAAWGPVFVADPALMGFHPSQLYSGRTVPPAHSPHWRRPTCRLPASTHPPRGFVRGHRPFSRILLNLVATVLFGRSGYGGFDSWALTRPHQPSAARVADGGELMLPWALPLAGLPGTSWCKRPGSLIDSGSRRWTGRTCPASLIGRQPRPLPVALRS